MNLNISWEKGIELVLLESRSSIYTVDLEKIPEIPGIYIFVRQYDDDYEALYVGRSVNLRNRVKKHLNNLKLMKHIQNAKTGKRYVIVGLTKLLSGQQINKVLPIIERTFIRHFLEQGHDLVNKQGSRIKRHEINSIGSHTRSFIPKRIYLEQR